MATAKRTVPGMGERDEIRIVPAAEADIPTIR